jgi:stringent starvation protein B
MTEVSTKPYLIRAIVEWCVDAGFTPYVAVAVDESVRVPQEFVKNGEIVLNISSLATHRLQVGNVAVEFQARFGGLARDVYVPIGRVIAVYARENGQGMAFELPRALQHSAPASEDGHTEVGADAPRPRALDASKGTMSLVPISLVPVLTRPAAPSGEADNASSAGPDANAPSSESNPSPNAPPNLPRSPPSGDRPRLTRIK